MHLCFYPQAANRLLRKIKGRQIRDHIFCLQSHVLKTILTYQVEFVMIARKKWCGIRITYLKNAKAKYVTTSMHTYVHVTVYFLVFFFVTQQSSHDDLTEKSAHWYQRKRKLKRWGLLQSLPRDFSREIGLSQSLSHYLIHFVFLYSNYNQRFNF